MVVGVMFASKSGKLLKLIHLSFLSMTMRSYVAPLCLDRLLTYGHTRTLFRTVDHIYTISTLLSWLQGAIVR